MYLIYLYFNILQYTCNSIYMYLFLLLTFFISNFYTMFMSILSNQLECMLYISFDKYIRKICGEPKMQGSGRHLSLSFLYNTSRLLSNPSKYPENWGRRDDTSSRVGCEEIWFGGKTDHRCWRREVSLSQSTQVNVQGESFPKTIGWENERSWFLWIFFYNQWSQRLEF